MLKLISKPTIRRVGILCAFLVGFFLIACQPTSVQPRYPSPDRMAADSTGSPLAPMGDQPPKDVGGGN